MIEWPWVLVAFIVGSWFGMILAALLVNRE